MRRRSWATVGVLAVAAAARVGCVGASTGPSPFADLITDILGDAGSRVITPALSRSRAKADALVTATEAWADAERSDAEAEMAHAAAQLAWRDAMAAWQEVEVLQVGPAGPSTLPGGENLRDEVYSWPTTNRCRVDQETVAADWESADFFAEHLVNVYGLAAMETLLFSDPGGNHCDAAVDINADGTWAALGVDAIQQRRADYAVILARGARDTVARLDDAWSPAGGNFSATLATAAAPYESQDQALQALFHSLFYLESATKDGKLGEPLGLRDCGAATCLDGVETGLAGGSNEWIAINLRSFRAAFTGADGSGLDDLLIAAGHPDLAAAMTTALDDADVAAAALTVPVDEAATGDPTAALALHGALSAITDLLRGDVATVLSLSIPSEVDGDND